MNKLKKYFLEESENNYIWSSELDNRKIYMHHIITFAETYNLELGFINHGCNLELGVFFYKKGNKSFNLRKHILMTDIYNSN